MKRKKTYHYLNSLRALSLIFVSAFHLFGHVFKGGFLAVICFLVLSGFLMEKSNINKEISLKDLFKKISYKYIGILGPILLIMAISLIISLIFVRDIFDDSVRSSLAVSFSFENIRQILKKASYFDRSGNFNIFTHLWYISLYMQFILIYYLIKYLKSKFKRFKPLIPMTLASIGLCFYLSLKNAPIIRIYYGTDTRIYGFLIGIISYRILCKYKITFEKRPMQAIILFLCVILSLPVFFIEGKNLWTYRTFFLFYSLAAGFLVCLLYLYENKLKLRARDIGLVGTILEYLGQRSLYLYIYQYIIQVFLSYLLKDKIKLEAVYYLINFLLVIILAEISFTVFKKANKNLIFILGLFLIIGLNLVSLVIGNKKAQELSELEKSFKESQEITSRKNQALKDKKIANEDLVADNSKEQKTKVKFDKKAYDDFDFTEDELNLIKNTSATAIGDSVLINIDKYLREYMPNLYLDGEVGRDMVEGPQVLSFIKESQGLNDIVVVALGSNGSANEEDLEKIMEISEDRDVYFVNTSHLQSYMDRVNKNLENFTKKNPRAHLVDWRSYVKDRPEILASDRTHPNIEGSEAYKNLIMRKIINVKSTALD